MITEGTPINLADLPDGARDYLEAAVELAQTDCLIDPWVMFPTPDHPRGGPLTSIPKERWRVVITNLLAHVKPSSYGFISEAWMAMVEKDDPLANNLLSGKLAVRDLPPDKRKDILMVALIWRENHIPEFYFQEVDDDLPTRGVSLQNFRHSSQGVWDSRHLITVW